MRSACFFLVAFCVCLAGLPALAQLSPERGKKLEITADGSLEWHRNEKFFRANKNVRAQQGSTTLVSALLTAKYTETKDNDMNITQIEAEGGVVIESAQSKAYGERAVYDLNKGLATMTGKGLKLVTSEQTVTAKDHFEYWAADGRLKAIGQAVAVQGQDRIEADELSAVFVKNAEGKRVLKTLEAKGNVKITTPKEVLTGDYGIYRAETNVAEVTGKVKIVRGPNTLEGNRAQVDLNTNVSSMFGGEGTGRVRAVFFPGSEKKPE
ncbi:MAG: ostA-like family protein [Rhodospirillales bacterium]|nr:ostA-like family protein [Alphaproteobacteria bacterium]MCB1840618.1 ostA-like family protein [Alphaproteobacteria bacterium]MCB9977218.1 ostA-like family protein [Rhodospirillales bacterium]